MLSRWILCFIVCSAFSEEVEELIRVKHFQIIARKFGEFERVIEEARSLMKEHDWTECETCRKTLYDGLYQIELIIYNRGFACEDCLVTEHRTFYV